MEEGEKEDTAVDPVGVGVGEDQEPLEAEAIAPEIGPHPGAERRGQFPKQRLRGDPARGRLDGIERLPLHREHGLEAGIADAGHGESRRFPLDDKQLCPRSRAMNLAVDKLDRTVMEGF
jgi:hypothetical protein